MYGLNKDGRDNLEICVSSGRTRHKWNRRIDREKKANVDFFLIQMLYFQSFFLLIIFVWAYNLPFPNQKIIKNQSREKMI